MTIDELIVEKRAAEKRITEAIEREIESLAEKSGVAPAELEIKTSHFNVPSEAGGPRQMLRVDKVSFVFVI